MVMQVSFFALLVGSFCFGATELGQASLLTPKNNSFTHYTQARLSMQQKRVIHETRKWVKNHCARHGDTDPERVKWISSYVLNILWRESNFRNIVNPNDKAYDGSRQTVSGYAQFRDDSYLELLQSYARGYPATFPKALRDQCSKHWKQGEKALRCQVEVLTYSVRRSFDGNPRHIRRWGTAAKAWADTQVELLNTSLPSRSIASN